MRILPRSLVMPVDEISFEKHGHHRAKGKTQIRPYLRSAVGLDHALLAMFATWSFLSLAIEPNGLGDADARRHILSSVSALRLRDGSHTGPVVAVVIDESKFAYDLWGDNVNIASRMESYDLPGRIYVSEAFVRAASDKWRFEARGLIEVRRADCP
jgi:class 3 adenylate cyclase